MEIDVGKTYDLFLCLFGHSEVSELVVDIDNSGTG